MKYLGVILVVCAVVCAVHGAEEKKKPVEKKKFGYVSPQECRADLNDCLDHSWAHLPDSPPVGYCCEHYNYCLYGP